MSNRDKLASIELYRYGDGTLRMEYIHWIGKPWDGFWQYNTISKKDLNKILGMLKPPKVPECCAKCEYNLQAWDSKDLFCRLEKMFRPFCGETEVEKMTIEMFNDERWKQQTPDWCPLKERNWKHG